MMFWDSEHMHGVSGWAGSAMMLAWMAILVVATIAIVVWMIRSGAASGKQDMEMRSPREVIDSRFARGEIDEAQRQKMIETLS